jgi:hypothetical protein
MLSSRPNTDLGDPSQANRNGAEFAMAARTVGDTLGAPTSHERRADTPALCNWPLLLGPADREARSVLSSLGRCPAVQRSEWHGAPPARLERVAGGTVSPRWPICASRISELQEFTGVGGSQPAAAGDREPVAYRRS